MKMALARYCFLLIIFLISGSALGQDDDHQWWNNKHNWDGVTAWVYYLKYSPAYFGPNALPVPEIRDAWINPKASLETRADFHFSKGDNTQNLFLKFKYPILDCKVALEIFVVPIEFYSMDTITRDERVSRDKDGKGYAFGDIYIATLVQILKDKKGWPDLLLGITLRTASGNNVGGARFTDMPGYYFDLSAGKSYNVGENIKLRPYIMLGFYVWQTNNDRWLQNDAFLYGIGASLYNDRFETNMKFGGYVGYIGDGDKPMVLRANAIYKRPRTHYKLSFQQGLNDFKYSTISAGVIFYFR
jgi:hypothetical protein